MRPAMLAIAAAVSLLASSPPQSRAADVESPPYAVQPLPGGPYGAPYAVQPGPEVPIEPPQYVYGGYSYCWFPAGWRGPGWYVCDYGPWVSGYWWGGPIGWQGWTWRGPRFYGGPRFHGGPRIYGGFRGQAFHGGPGGMHMHRH
jgi:hypothetical protein